MIRFKEIIFKYILHQASAVEDCVHERSMNLKKQQNEKMAINNIAKNGKRKEKLSMDYGINSKGEPSWSKDTPDKIPWKKVELATKRDTVAEKIWNAFRHIIINHNHE